MKGWNSFLLFKRSSAPQSSLSQESRIWVWKQKVHTVIFKTNVGADFSAFVLLSPNGSLFCLKEQLMTLHIRDFLCTGHRCPANWETSFTPFLLFILLKSPKSGFPSFYVGEWGAFVEGGEGRGSRGVKMTLYYGHFLSEAPLKHPRNSN